MANEKPLTASERCAWSLLMAWESGDLPKLQDRTQGALAMEMAGPPSEQERMELVQEVASRIRLWLQGGRGNAQNDLSASLKLLRHLARCEDASEIPSGKNFRNPGISL